MAKGMIDNPQRSLSVEKSRSLNGVENGRSFPFLAYVHELDYDAS